MQHTQVCQHAADLRISQHRYLLLQLIFVHTWAQRTAASRQGLLLRFLCCTGPMEHRGGAFPANGTTLISGSASVVLAGSVMMATVLASLNLQTIMDTYWWAKAGCLAYDLCCVGPSVQTSCWEHLAAGHCAVRCHGVFSGKCEPQHRVSPCGPCRAGIEKQYSFVAFTAGHVTVAEDNDVGLHIPYQLSRLAGHYEQTVHLRYSQISRSTTLLNLFSDRPAISTYLLAASPQYGSAGCAILLLSAAGSQGRCPVALLHRRCPCAHRRSRSTNVAERRRCPLGSGTSGWRLAHVRT